MVVSYFDDLLVRVDINLDFPSVSFFDLKKTTDSNGLRTYSYLIGGVISRNDTPDLSDYSQRRLFFLLEKTFDVEFVDEAAEDGAIVNGGVVSDDNDFDTTHYYVVKEMEFRTGTTPDAINAYLPYIEQGYKLRVQQFIQNCRIQCLSKPDLPAPQLNISGKIYETTELDLQYFLTPLLMWDYPALV